MDMVYGLMTIAIIIELLIIIYLWTIKTEPKEYIEGRTIIELNILAREHLIDTDKFSLAAEYLDTIEYENIPQWMKDTYHEKVLRKLYDKKTIDKILKVVKESKISLN